tara:strand:+ start:2331 stop:4706 length:2376 start_codon:yes stop_codon:yes gene_type:complete
MDLEQNKLTKEEWESIEIPSNDDEKEILKLIVRGFHNVNLKENNTLTILSYLKLPSNEVMNNYIFMKYIQPEIINIYKKYNIKYKPLESNKKFVINKADTIRFEHMEKNLLERKNIIFEFTILKYIENILKHKDSDTKWIEPFYILKVLLNNNIQNINSHLLDLVKTIIDYFEDAVEKSYIVENANKIINKNADIIKYKDKKLFEHQKELFTKIKSITPKLILYIAPTGTGKTLSPIGLSESYKILFVCAVRHVGLALAKAAITIEKKVAFAFGCEDVDDIRLHYFSAKEYIKNKKSGGVFKVDNSIGDNVEIMISDIKSYLYAMHYMLAFNDNKNIILYWDEPTITLDYNEHKFHSIIKNNWEKNLIQNIILSSATLPTLDEMKETVNNYKTKFNGDVHSIKTYDCTKSISIINRDGYIEVPHYISDNYNDILKSCKYIESNKTIMRYVGLEECTLFIKYINKKKFYKNDIYSIDEYFNNIEEITIDSIKMYYLNVLKNIKSEEWENIYNYLKKNRKCKYSSTTNIASSDAFTLVNGPTIYITEEINKIAFFCIKSLNIPDNILDNISEAIDYNYELNQRIITMEKNYEDGINKEDMKENKLTNDRGIPPELKVLKNKIESLKESIKTISLPDMYIPNKKEHLFKWKRDDISNVFTSDISEYVVEQIMLINDMNDIWKLLLLMGIGVFSSHTSKKYTEIMKDLAKSKKLYLIIASSDYIYGTNYQFDHCYLGKDLTNMTQEKIIQAMGRVGRNKISDEYSIRLRNDRIINKIFYYEYNKPEVENIQKLFS